MGPSGPKRRCPAPAGRQHRQDARARRPTAGQALAARGGYSTMNVLVSFLATTNRRSNVLRGMLSSRHSSIRPNTSKAATSLAATAARAAERPDAITLHVALDLADVVGVHGRHLVAATGAVGLLPGPETAILGGQAPCVPTPKQHGEKMYCGER